MPAPAPIVYGKYRLLEPLARGGMAEVFKAKAHGVEGFEKVLVIKRILADLCQNPSFVEMFINEAKIAVSLSHANIVQVFDLGHAEGTYFIAMEYVAGMDMATLLRLDRKSQRRLRPEIGVYIVSELAKALDYAHRRRDTHMQPLNIVHRDVSPQNVLLSHEGEVKLTDFGIAKTRLLAQKVTQLGMIKGKYAYMAPEQIEGGRVDARADIFATGILLYEALTGSNPFHADSAYDTLRRIQGGQYAPVREFLPDLPDEIDRIISRTLALEPERRFASAGELYESLIQFLYSTGRLAGARDLAEHLSALRTGGDEAGAGGHDGLKAAFSADSWALEGPEAMAATRVGRVRPARDSKGRPNAEHRERRERREVTALALLSRPDDPLEAATVERLVTRCNGTLVSHADRGHRSASSVAFALFGQENPDGRDSDNAAVCALRLARAAGASAAEAGAPTTLTIGAHAARITVDLAGALVVDDAYETLLSGARAVAELGSPGQILVDESAKKALREHSRLLPVHVQGRELFVLTGERPIADAPGRFVGRREELKAIGDRLYAANEGHVQVLALRGEPGSGKSRMLGETMRRLMLAGHRAGLHVASLSPQMQNRPLSAVSEMLRRVLAVDEFDPEALLRDRTHRLRELGLVPLEQAAIAAHLGLPTDGRRRSSDRSLRTALLRIIRRLADDQLTIFAWDGAEYMDEQSAAMIGAMLRSVKDVRVAFILSHDADVPLRWMGGESPWSIRLGPLSDDEVARLTADRVGAKQIPFELLRELTTKSGGNPLYVEEYLKALREAGAIRLQGGEIVYEPEQVVEIPKTLSGIVSARVAALDATARYLLQVASVVGARFTQELVAGAAGEDASVAGEGFASPKMEGILVRRTATEYEFARELVRQVVHESLTLHARREIHAAVADAMEHLYPHNLDELAERLAHHRREAAQMTEAVDYLVRASERLQREGALAKAADTLLGAIDILVTSSQGERERLLRLYERLGELCYRTRNLHKGAEHMARALEIAEAMDDRRFVASLSMWRGRLLVSASRTEEGHRYLDQAHQLARELADRELFRDVLIAVAEADARRGHYDTAVGFLREALSLARGSGARAAEMECLLPLSLTYARMGDHAAAMDTLAQAKLLAEQRRDAMSHCRVLKLESQVYYHARDQGSSARAASQALEIAKGAGFHYECVLNAHNMGESYMRLGDHKRAFAALRYSYELATEHAFSKLQMANLRVLGFIDATRFGSSEGRSRLLQSIAYAQEHGYVWDVIQGKYLLAVLQQIEGDSAEAASTLREVLRLADSHGHRKYIEDTEQALNDLARGRSIELPL